MIVEAIDIEGANLDFVLSTKDWGGTNMELAFVAGVSDCSYSDVSLSISISDGVKILKSDLTH